MSEFNHVKIETGYSNCFIVPYTTDENYINAVNTIINPELFTGQQHQLLKSA